MALFGWVGLRWVALGVDYTLTGVYGVYEVLGVYGVYGVYGVLGVYEVLVMFGGMGCTRCTWRTMGAYNKLWRRIYAMSNFMGHSIPNIVIYIFYSRTGFGFSSYSVDFIQRKRRVNVKSCVFFTLSTEIFKRSTVYTTEISIYRG